jgi:anion-transporting  ArsA/GET3 family ATPase
VEVKRNNLLQTLLTGKLKVFTGKGGVGKTSVASALALCAARAGKRVLLAEVGAPRSIPPLFGATVDGNGPVRIADGITWINFTPAAALEVYALRVLKFRSVYRAVFEQRAVQRFLRAIPSLAEILVLGHLAHLIEEDAFDLAVLDAPSSGPGALMLEAPRVVLQSAPPGPLREGAEWIQRLLDDPEKTTVHLVVLLEELPVSEAIGLHHRLRNELGLSVGTVIANRALPDPFFPEGRQLFDSDHQRGPEGLTRASRIYRTRLGLQEAYLDRLRAGISPEVTELPELFDPQANVVGLLSSRLEESP